jgi:hypothetical protein
MRNGSQTRRRVTCSLRTLATYDTPYRSVAKQMLCRSVVAHLRSVRAARSRTHETSRLRRSSLPQTNLRRSILSRLDDQARRLRNGATVQRDSYIPCRRSGFGGKPYPLRLRHKSFGTVRQHLTAKRSGIELKSKMSSHASYSLFQLSKSFPQSMAVHLSTLRSDLRRLPLPCLRRAL